MSRDLSPPREPKTCRLGILGTRQDLTSAEVTQLLELISDDIQAMYLPQEGYVSIYAETYAEQRDIPATVLEAEWRRHGKSAKARRDAEIIRHSTHFLIFGGARSQQPLNVAKTLLRRGRQVFYLPHNSLELEALEEEEPAKPLNFQPAKPLNFQPAKPLNFQPAKPPKPSPKEPGHTSSKGKMHSLQQWIVKSDP